MPALHPVIVVVHVNYSKRPSNPYTLDTPPNRGVNKQQGQSMIALNVQTRYIARLHRLDKFVRSNQSLNLPLRASEHGG
jgi:hypothetical protein